MGLMRSMRENAQEWVYGSTIVYVISASIFATGISKEGSPQQDNINGEYSNKVTSRSYITKRVNTPTLLGTLGGTTSAVICVAASCLDKRREID